jgi:hypothetical protein
MRILSCTSIKTPGTMHPVLWLHISEERRLQLDRCLSSGLTCTLYSKISVFGSPSTALGYSGKNWEKLRKKISIENWTGGGGGDVLSGSDWVRRNEDMWRREVQLHTFLTFALDIDECSNSLSTSSLARLFPITSLDASGDLCLNRTKW